MITVLTNSKILPSARILATSLGEVTKERVQVTSLPERVRGDTVIRYGNSFGPFKGTINPPEFIRIISSKRNFSSLMEKEGVLSPVFRKDAPREFPVMIRKTLTGFGGAGIVVVENMDQFTNNWASSYWWTPYISTSLEVRVHFMDWKPVKVFKKIHREGISEKFPVRNMAKYHFSLRGPETYPMLDKLAADFSRIFGNNTFCSADIGWCREAKCPIVFELNSAPGLSEETSKLYAGWLADKIK